MSDLIMSMELDKLKAENIQLSEQLRDITTAIQGTQIWKARLNEIEKMRSALVTIREDAVMALSEEWDRSDDGFKAQIDMIDVVLMQC